MRWVMIVLFVFAMAGCKSEKPAPEQATDCASSDDCKEHGLCTEAPDGSCVVGSQNDCAQSNDCKRKGWCAPTDVGGKRLCKP